MTREGVGNILLVYNRATPEELTYGLSWYSSAHLQADKLARKYDQPLEVAASVIAVLSPGTTWQQNLRDAEEVLRAVHHKWRPKHVTIASYPLNKEKAFKLARGGKRDEWLRGLKVNSFFHNILDPERSLDVTVDGHSYSLWLGARHNMVTVPSRVYRNPTYSRIADDFREAARELSIRPHQCQAVCWLAWRRQIDVRQRAGEEQFYQEVAA